MNGVAHRVHRQAPGCDLPEAARAGGDDDRRAHDHGAAAVEDGAIAGAGGGGAGEGDKDIGKGYINLRLFLFWSNHDGK